MKFQHQLLASFLFLSLTPLLLILLFNNDGIAGIFLIGIFFSVIALLLASSLYQKFNNSLMQLRNAVHEITEGKYFTKVNQSSIAEINDCINSFNNMIRHIEESQKIFTENVKKTSEETNKRYRELERFNKTMINRELKMIELKNQIVDLKKRLNEKGANKNTTLLINKI